jgi:hypothetical protein
MCSMPHSTDKFEQVASVALLFATRCHVPRTRIAGLWRGAIRQSARSSFVGSPSRLSEQKSPWLWNYRSRRRSRLVTGDPREKAVYQGSGDQRSKVGRATDADGRQVSSVNAGVIADPLGVIGDAQVPLLPDLQMTGLKAGAAIRLDGWIQVRLSGQQFGVITAQVTAERQTPLGNYVEWAQTAGSGKPRPGGDVKAA